MPPTTAARWKTTCGRASAKRRSICARSRRSYSAERGANTSRQPRARRPSTTNEPRKPAPPVTTTRLSDQRISSLPAAPRGLERRHVRVHHQARQLPEGRPRLPAQLLPRPRGVADEQVHLGGAVVLRVYFDVAAPVQPRVRESLFQKLPDRVGLARRHHVV